MQTQTSKCVSHSDTFFLELPEKKKKSLNRKGSRDKSKITPYCYICMSFNMQYCQTLRMQYSFCKRTCKWCIYWFKSAISISQRSVTPILLHAVATVSENVIYIIQYIYLRVCYIFWTCGIGMSFTFHKKFFNSLVSCTISEYLKP